MVIDAKAFIKKITGFNDKVQTAGQTRKGATHMPEVQNVEALYIKQLV